MIYILEDDASIRKLVVYTLQSQGMEAQGFDRPSQFWEAMEKGSPELVLLDIMLPEEDGLQVLKRLRSMPATKTLPVIMLTAKSTEYDKVLGLDEGADDYVAKPFGMMELMARVRTALRHAGQNQPKEKTYSLGSLFVDPERHIVRDGDREVTLTLKEFQVLYLLLERAGTVLPGTSCSTPSGAMSLTAPAGLWTYISVPCVRSLANPATALRRCGASATRSVPTDRRRDRS